MERVDWIKDQMMNGINNELDIVDNKIEEHSQIVYAASRNILYTVFDPVHGLDISCSLTDNSSNDPSRHTASCLNYFDTFLDPAMK